MPRPASSPVLRAAVVAAAALAVAAHAQASATRLLHVHTDPGNFVDAATTRDATGAPTFIFGSGFTQPASASAYDSSGQQRWSFFNQSAGTAVKIFQTTAARRCESGGKGAGPVDVFVTESDLFNDTGFSVFGLSSGAQAAAPVWTFRCPGCSSTDGGFTVKAADDGGRVIVQYTGAGGAAVAGVNGQTGAVEWTFNTKNPLSGTDTSAEISANGAWVLFVDAFAPDTLNNATVLVGATGQVRDSSIPLPYYSPASAISDSGNYVVVVDEIAVNVYKWTSKRAAYKLAYVLPPPAGVAVTQVVDVVTSTGPDQAEMLVALYSRYRPDAVVVGMWNLTDGQLLSSWSANTSTFGGLSADGEYVAAGLEDGAVLLRRGASESVFQFSADVMFSVSINVVRSPGGGGGDTVFLAAAGGNNDAGGKGNTGDAYAYQIDVPAAAPPAPTAMAAPVPCTGEFNGGQPLEEVCFTTLLNSSNTKGLSVRTYAAAAEGAVGLVSYNVSALFPAATFDDALTLGGFGVIEYFLGGFNKLKKNVLDARTVPFLLLPPGGAGGWAGRMALAPSRYPAGKAAPAPLDNVTLVALYTQPLVLAVQRESAATPLTGDQFAALCARAVSAVAAGALPGYRINPASPFAAGVYALYYGRDAPSGGPFVAECWLGVEGN